MARSAAPGIYQHLPRTNQGYWMDGHNSGEIGYATPGMPGIFFNIFRVHASVSYKIMILDSFNVFFGFLD